MAGGRKRGPRYQNTFAFTHNSKSKLTAKILAMPNDGLCKRCWDKVEWRKKYRKYKPLTQPAKCNGCQERTVRAAYHTLCQDCAKQRRVCAWCGEDKFIVSVNTDQESFIKTGNDLNQDDENVHEDHEGLNFEKKRNSLNNEAESEEMNIGIDDEDEDQDEDEDEQEDEGEQGQEQMDSKSDEEESKVAPLKTNNKVSTSSTPSSNTFPPADPEKIEKNRKKLERELESFPLPLRKKKTILREFDRANGNIEIHRLLTGMSLHVKPRDDDDDFDDDFDEFSDKEDDEDEEDEDEDEDEDEEEDDFYPDTKEAHRTKIQKPKNLTGSQGKMINI